MATTKLAITLPDEQLEEVRSLVAAGRAVRVSGFAQHAVAIALQDAGWQATLDDALQQTGGPLTRDERAWADAMLAPRTPKRRRRKGA